MQQEHLEYRKIQRYRLSQLSPTELLDFDDHLAICDKCRHKALQENDLTQLYDSFITENKPVKSVSGNFLRFKFSRQLQFAAVLLGFFSLAGTLGYFFVQNQSTEIIIVDNINDNTAQSPAKDASELTANTSSPETTPSPVSQKPTITPLILKKKRTIETHKQTSEISKTQAVSSSPIVTSNNKRIDESLSFKISELKTDNSQTLGSESVTKSSVSAKVKVSKAGKSYAIEIDSDDKADYYEFYLAEMPNFVSVSKEKIKTSKWRVPQNKLQKNKKYVLQITLYNKDGQIQTIRKVLSLGKPIIPKNKK
jgi:hypothetical protein